MILNSDVSLSFSHYYNDLVSGPLSASLLRAFIRARFQPKACREALQRALGHGAPQELFAPTAFSDGDLIVSTRALYPDSQRLRLLFDSRVGGRHERFTIDVDDHGRRDIADLLRLALRGTSSDAFVDQYSDLGAEFLQQIVAQPPSNELRWIADGRPGIYRREHAALLVRSATTTVLLDPLSRHSTLPRMRSKPTTGESIDAILISHSHLDHWDPLAIIELAYPTTRVVVPLVPRRSILTPSDMEAELHSFGIAAEAHSWWQSISVGDMEIDILPFFGEQPTRRARLPDDSLRSFGNCFRIQTPSFSALILVDSGADPDGSMVAVAEESRRRRGPVDVVLACMRQFPSPFFAGLSTYWAPVPYDVLRPLFRDHEASRLEATTAGPEGIAAICAASGARYFLPYAHGYEGVLQPISDIGWGNGEAPETEALAVVARELRQQGTDTIACSWRVGDIARFGTRTMAIASGFGAELVRL